MKILLKRGFSKTELLNSQILVNFPIRNLNWFSLGLIYKVVQFVRQVLSLPSWITLVKEYMVFLMLK